MNEPKFTFVEPGRDRRKRKEHLKAVMKHQPGTERAVELANLARDFHEDRELNMAMDTARQCLLESEGTVSLLVNAYICHDRDDHAIEDLAMLADLARWLDDDGLQAIVRAMAFERGLGWCGCTDGRERERRIDTLRRRFDDGLANEVDLALI